MRTFAACITFSLALPSAGSSFAAPHAKIIGPIEIKGKSEFEQYKRLQKQAQQREVSLIPQKIEAAVEKRFVSDWSTKVLVSPNRKKFLKIKSRNPGISYRASLHRVSDGALLKILSAPKEEIPGAYEAQWSPDGTIVSFSELEEGNSLFFDAKTGRRLWDGDQRYLYAPDSKSVVMIQGYDSKTKRRFLTLCNSRTGRIIRFLPSPPTTYGIVPEFYSPMGRSFM